MIDTEQFKIRSYTKKELALLYFPDSTPPSAVNHLMQWIRQCDALWNRLQQNGYRKMSKSFTPRQVQIIIDNLGEP